MTISARRQLFRRSKAGCWNCRSKKKKCDELRPHCTRCIRAGESCRYPDANSDSSDLHASVSSNGYVSPSMTSSASFPNSLSMHAAPILSRSSSSASFSSHHHSRHGQRHAYQHHPYAPPSGPSHPPLQQRDYHPQGRLALHQRPSPPPPYATHHPYHNTPPAPVASNQPPPQHIPPPPMSANAAADWDRTSEQHVSKRVRHDEFSSSSSSNSSNAALQDARARQQPFDAHHRIPSNHSQTSSKGKGRDTLAPISPHQSYSVPMAASASLPPLVSSSAQRPAASPVASIRSANTSPTDHTSPVFPNSHRSSSGMAAASAQGVAPNDRLAPPTGYPSSHPSAPLSGLADTYETQPVALRSPPPRNASEAARPRTKLVLDYNSTEPDPEDLLVDLHSHSMSIVTQPTKGAEAYFRLLQGIARMSQGQAMAHALAAMIATHQAKLYNLKRQGDKAAPASPSLTKDASPGSATNASASEPTTNGSEDDRSTQLLDLADRHHLAAIKALQTQQQPSRRRRFSVIETNSGKGGDELPPGSNASVMMLLILACGSAGKSLMLPSYFNQCEQFLADAVQDVSSRRLFPSVTEDPIVGNAEDPPIQAPEELDNYCLLLFIATVVGLYECYLAQYTAIADWDYNPARLRRLVPFNCSPLDVAIFDSTRAGVSETTFSVSIVTLELVIETLDTMRKFKRAESAAYGNRKSSRSEAEDGVAALDSLALREELGLLIRDLEGGAFWKGPIRCLSNAEQLLVIDFIEGTISADTLAQKVEEEARTNNKAGSRMPPPSSSDDLTCRAVTKAFMSGDLVHVPKPGEPKQVNRLRLANHLFRNALLVDLYVNVFNRATTSLAVRELVSRSISLLGAVHEKLEQGLEWPVIVLGSYAQDEPERNKVRSFLKRSQWKGTEGPQTAAQIIERVWAEDAPSWRESAIYFGSPYLS